MKLTHSIASIPIVLMSQGVFAADIPVDQDITQNTTWTADNTYIINKSIFVKNGAHLTIEPGTLILGDRAPGPDGVLKTNDDTYGSLVVARGSKLFAEGTVERPIVMTAIQERDGIDGNPKDKPDPALGDGAFWGGLVLLGAAPVNYYVGGVNANEHSIEGFPAGSSGDILYGGNNAGDSSGVVKYVSIRFGGYVFNAQTGSEINGFTLGGVGSGTVVDSVEIVSNTDDGIEIFGGTVNTKRIAVAFCQDDMFDLDEGHSGFHQFWFGIQNSNPGIGDRGGEWDGGNGNTKAGTPYTNTRIYNATIIGDGAANVTSQNQAFYLDDYFSGQLHNSVIHDFSGPAIAKDEADGVGNGTTTAPPAEFSNNTWGNFGLGAGLLATLNQAGSPSGTGNSDIGTNPLLKGISRITDGGLDPRPAAGSPLLSSSLSAFPNDAPAGFFEETDYRGAFGEANWLRGWSYLHQAGYLNEILVDADITANTTWSKHETYIMRKSIFVKNGATLTIEPGSLILGDNAPGPDNALGTNDDTYGSLVITRNGKIMADGTREKPIIFTAWEAIHGIDGDLLTPLSPALGDGAFWGGIVVLGNAPLNYYVGGVNANEHSIEGFPAGSSVDILYGGNNPNDNSGVLRYISNRFGGYVFNATAGSEINGLTLGGVGSGTTIEFMEIVSNTDDGMEIFGGTVNTRYIAAAFCQDDSFDLDEGHTGFHQFWFAIQNGNPAIGDRGGEWDGGNGNTKAGTPFTNTRIYNATFIGDGASNVASLNQGFFLDDFFSGQLHNSIIHDFSGPAIAKDTDGVGDGVTTAPPAVFSNNTWGSFGSGGGLLDTLNQAGSPSGVGNSAIGTNPSLVGISRVANKGLDPRPNLNSPAYTSSLSGFPSGSPAGFFTPVSYRGAFGGDNWLNDWSYLSRWGYLSGLPDAGGDSGGGGGTGEPPFVDVDGDGISDALENSPALQALGFSVGTNDAALFASLFTPTSVQEVYADSVIVQKDSVNNTATLTIPVEKSDDLVPPFDFVGNATLVIPNVPVDKEFYRIRVAPDAP